MRFIGVASLNSPDRKKSYWFSGRAIQEVTNNFIYIYFSKLIKAYKRLDDVNYSVLRTTQSQEMDSS